MIYLPIFYNGTRLQMNNLHNYVIEITVLTGCVVGKKSLLLFMIIISSLESRKDFSKFDLLERKEKVGFSVYSASIPKL